jgi:ELWxxDGT repeat protein
MVKDITPGPGDSHPEALTNVGGTLFFNADDGTHGSELWKSDGTTAGTVLVKDVTPGVSDYLGPIFLTNVGGTLFFNDDDGIHGRELWKSDGTGPGTVMVKNIKPRGGSAGRFGPSDLTNVRGTLFFVANDGTHGYELWKSDGTTAGTIMVKDITPGASGSDPLYLTEVGSRLFFNARDDGHGRRLWRSDGTSAGTVLVVEDVNPHPA